MNYGVGNPKGEKGKDGVSPIVSVESITGGYEITITDANGTQTFIIMNGQDGTNGTNGQDGTTPNISVNANVNNSVGTPSVSVVKSGTDANPTFTFSFQNLKGETGTTTIKTQIVNNLPSTGDTDTIYFVPNNSGESENLYNEYLYVNNAWERVDSKIDLSNYIQKSNTSGLVKNDGTIDTNNYVTMGDIKNEPILLWENPNPNTSFPATNDIQLTQSVENFNYIVVGFKLYKNADQSIIFNKFILKKDMYFHLYSVSTSPSENLIVTRTCYVNNSDASKINVGSCYFNQLQDNNRNIPICIYGTNIL